MASATVRIKRYLESEIGGSHSSEFEDRLDELETLEALLESDRIKQEVRLFNALANETRFKLIRLLVAAEDELCVCELNAMIDATESAISHGLSRLHEDGLVTRRKDGRWRKYRATNAAVAVVSLLEGVVENE